MWWRYEFQMQMNKHVITDYDIACIPPKFLHVLLYCKPKKTWAWVIESEYWPHSWFWSIIQHISRSYIVYINFISYAFITFEQWPCPFISSYTRVDRVLKLMTNYVTKNNSYKNNAKCQPSLTWALFHTDGIDDENWWWNRIHALCMRLRTVRYNVPRQMSFECDRCSSFVLTFHLNFKSSGEHGYTNGFNIITYAWLPDKRHQFRKNKECMTL